MGIVDGGIIVQFPYQKLTKELSDSENPLRVRKFKHFVSCSVCILQRLWKDKTLTISLL